MTRFLMVVALVAACNHTTGDTPSPKPTTAPSDAPHPTHSDAPMSTRTWQPHTLANLGLTVSVLDGVAVDERDLGDIHAVTQHAPSLDVLVYAGKTMSLAWWRNRFQPTAKLGPETAVQVCGRPGHRQEVTAAADSATGVFGKQGSGVIERTVTTPARVHVAIDGTTSAGVGFVVSWVVDADQRDAMRADEDRFLTSITCS